MNRSVIRVSIRLYDFLLMLYPSGFRQEFGEEMTFVFSESLRDACSERGRRSLPALWGRTIVDVAKSLVIQHIESQKERGTMDTQRTNGILQNSLVRAALATALFLLLPLSASLLIEEFNWGVFDFVIIAALVFAAGLTFDLITRRSSSNAYRAAFAVAIGTAAFLFVSNLAVGLIGSEDEPANLMYLMVIAIALLGTILARFRSRGMALAMFVTALAQASTVAIALILGLHRIPQSSVVEIIAVNGFFALGWVVAGLLFRWAAETEYKVASNHVV